MQPRDGLGMAYLEAENLGLCEGERLSVDFDEALAGLTAVLVSCERRGHSCRCRDDAYLAVGHSGGYWRRPSAPTPQTRSLKVLLTRLLLAEALYALCCRSHNRGDAVLAIAAVRES